MLALTAGLVTEREQWEGVPIAAERHILTEKLCHLLQSKQQLAQLL